MKTMFSDSVFDQVIDFARWRRRREYVFKKQIVRLTNRHIQWYTRCIGQPILTTTSVHYLKWKIRFIRLSHLILLLRKSLIST